MAPYELLLGLVIKFRFFIKKCARFGMAIFNLILWSQQESSIVNRIVCEGSRDDAEHALSDFWNKSRAVLAEPERYRA